MRTPVAPALWIGDVARLLLAAYFALVLPFVCWGAAATPGHPHARPHFVFALPQLAVAPAPSRVQHVTGNELVAWRSRDAWCGSPQHTGSAHSGTQDSPTGQSTPSLLGITLLAPILLLAVAFATPGARSGFLRFLRTVVDRTVVGELHTPPPRFAL